MLNLHHLFQSEIESISLKLDQVNKDMSKKDEDLRNVTQVINEMKDDMNQEKALKELKEQNKELKEMLQKALSAFGKGRR